MKVVINPSWNCQLHCPYCWLPHTKINRDAKEHEWFEWVDAIIRHVPTGSIIDVSGGDPLLYRGLVTMLRDLAIAGYTWAITTNALNTPRVEMLVSIRPRNCAVINVSDHSGNIEAHHNIQRLKSVYPVVVHRCDHPGAGTHEANAGKITYQKWAEGEALDGVKRTCNAGINHAVIDPGGDVFRCCVDMQVANKPLGNIFDKDFRFADKPILCDFGCSTCYTSVPDAWPVHSRVI